MPIRFDCDHCHGMLSIARRKAYTIIDCPKCGCKQVVPGESKISEETANIQNSNLKSESGSTAVRSLPSVKEKSGSSKEQPLFERNDIENLLKTPSKKIENVSTVNPTVPKVNVEPSASVNTAELAMGVELVSETGGITIRKNQLITAIVLGVFGLISMFTLGVIVGRMISK
jgi:phage FluMu protein Com